LQCFSKGRNLTILTKETLKATLASSLDRVETRSWDSNSSKMTADTTQVKPETRTETRGTSQESRPLAPSKVTISRRCMVTWLISLASKSRIKSLTRDTRLRLVLHRLTTGSLIRRNADSQDVQEDELQSAASRPSI